MNKIGIFNETDESIKSELQVVKKVLELGITKENLDSVEFNIICVTNDYIHALNKMYRNVDSITDVITFALEDDSTVVVESSTRILGDIYISIDRAREQAENYGHSFLRELCFLAVHGFYHLLGYDHQTKEEENIMFKKQEEVLQEYGITRE